MAANPYYQGPITDHFDGTRFHNPGQADSDKSLLEVLRWRLTSKPARWPTGVPVTPVVPQAHVDDSLRVTMVGHASLLLQLDGHNVLTDPVWSPRASPLSFAGPKRVTIPGIEFERLPPIHAVLLSHNHYDHLDLDTLARLQGAHRPVFAMPLGNDTIVKSRVPDARCLVGDWGDRLELAPGLVTRLVPANHWSSRGLGDRRMALWAGHVLDTDKRRVYFAGDSGYGGGRIFADIGRDFGGADVACLPIGAYAPRWFMAPQHADPEEALRMFQAVRARKALGIHWGTFQLTDEARLEPAERLQRAVAAAGLSADTFKAAEVAGVYDFPTATGRGA